MLDMNLLINLLLKVQLFFIPWPFWWSKNISVQKAVYMFNNGNHYTMLLVEQNPRCPEETYRKEVEKAGYISADRADRHELSDYLKTDPEAARLCLLRPIKPKEFVRRSSAPNHLVPSH